MEKNYFKLGDEIVYYPALPKKYGPIIKGKIIAIFVDGTVAVLVDKEYKKDCFFSEVDNQGFGDIISKVETKENTTNRICFVSSHYINKENLPSAKLALLIDGASGTKDTELEINIFSDVVTVSIFGMKIGSFKAEIPNKILTDYYYSVFGNMFKK